MKEPQFLQGTRFGLPIAWCDLRLLLFWREIFLFGTAIFFSSRDMPVNQILQERKAGKFYLVLADYQRTVSIKVRIGRIANC